jgi:acetyl esterase/lipase
MSTVQQTTRCPDQIVPYKQVGDLTLTLDLFIPEKTGGEAAPVVVFYHGGGWTGGTPAQFYPQSVDLRNQGVLCVSVEYRLGKKHGTTPYECIRDAFDAMRYVKEHVVEWGGDPDRIAAGGGSAGAHLAAALATVTAEDLAGAPEMAALARPDLLLLFNPVFDNRPDEEGGYGNETLGERWQEVSPVHLFHKNLPPVLILIGDEDALIPVSTIERASRSLAQLGVPHEVKIYGGGDHGFFNEHKHEGVFYAKTLVDLEAFLRKVGWISAT